MSCSFKQQLLSWQYNVTQLNADMDYYPYFCFKITLNKGFSKKVEVVDKNQQLGNFFLYQQNS